VLDLGQQPLANSLVLPERASEPEPKYPLRLMVCEGCWLLQILDWIPPAQLYSDYVYFSSFSDEILRHAREAATRYTNEFQLGSGNLVIEIASNDGYMLKNFVKSGVPSLGIEPAKNIATVARGQGVDTVVDFFDEKLATSLRSSGRQADLILGNNVFAHAPDINDFVSGLRILLKPKGRVILEFPYAVDLFEKS